MSPADSLGLPTIHFKNFTNLDSAEMPRKPLTEVGITPDPKEIQLLQPITLKYIRCTDVVSPVVQRCLILECQEKNTIPGNLKPRSQ